ncbi:hypothetical protein [Fimbriiglobus ruber]|uniref:Uncharacterized protein n=1 Tax=Fimbriiglobus ruber TaxID=1908690 RepID=A0A225DE46_9BACT|nr:hypothetical protein [Fimbriiglobus ruber]OWK36798.1 hypothetical protein FRUB_09361 [Fimbriiglobus ruber]
MDATAVQNCNLNTRKRTLTEIEVELNRLANSQPAWLACRQVLTRMRQDVQQDFPSHPNLAAVTTVAQAEQHITTAPWFNSLSAKATAWTTAGRVLSELQAAEQVFSAALTNGQWVAEFSGKEMFRRLRDYVYQPPQNPGYPDSDFAKAIGEWQQTNGQVPADLVDLRSALRSKVGLPP